MASFAWYMNYFKNQGLFQYVTVNVTRLKLLSVYKQRKRMMRYIQVDKNGVPFEKQLTQTEYIRHQIHHPENKHNLRFSEADLCTSIELMRAFIQAQP